MRQSRFDSGQTLVIYLWDVKHKKFKFKHFDISFQLAEFHAGSVGLGFDFYHSKNPEFHRYDHHAWLVSRFLWIDFAVCVDWGRKQYHVERIRRMVLTAREARAKMGL